MPATAFSVTNLRQPSILTLNRGCEPAGLQGDGRPNSRERAAAGGNHSIVEFVTCGATLVPFARSHLDASSVASALMRRAREHPKPWRVTTRPRRRPLPDSRWVHRQLP